MLTFSHERYAQIVAETIRSIDQLGHLKGGEYAGDDDRLANFRRNALALGVSMETVWAVYAGKHWDAIQQYVKDLSTGKDRQRLEGLDGRADDLIVYLILFKCIYAERNTLLETPTPSIGLRWDSDIAHAMGQLDAIIEAIDDASAEAEVDFPAGREGGARVSLDTRGLRATIQGILEGAVPVGDPRNELTLKGMAKAQAADRLVPRMKPMTDGDVT